MAKKKSAFSDAYTAAFGAVAAIYALVSLADRIPFGERREQQIANFRDWVSRLADYSNRFGDAYATVRPLLEKAIPAPEVVSACGCHQPFAHDIVGPLCRRILKFVGKGLANSHDGLNTWRDSIRSRALNVPTIDELNRLSALLRIENQRVGGPDITGGDNKTPKRQHYTTVNDPSADAKLVADWQAVKTRGCPTIAEFCRRRGLDEGDFRAAYDRHRKARRRKV